MGVVGYPNPKIDDVVMVQLLDDAGKLVMAGLSRNYNRLEQKTLFRLLCQVKGKEIIQTLLTALSTCTRERYSWVLVQRFITF